MRRTEREIKDESEMDLIITASIVKAFEEKHQALTAIMKQYSQRTFTFPEEALSRTTVIKVEIEAIAGKPGRPA